MSTLDYDIDLSDYDYLTGRQVIISNASTIASILAIGLGVFFILTAIVLIIAYVASVGGSTNPLGRGLSGDSDDYVDPNSRKKRSAPFPGWLKVLHDLEEAMALYGVGSGLKKCHRRLVCEAFLPNAHGVNGKAAQQFISIVKQLTPEILDKLEGEDKTTALGFKKAAGKGSKDRDCHVYEKECTEFSLKKLSYKNLQGE